MIKKSKIGFIGGGNMAEAIIKGLISGGVPAKELLIAEPVAARRAFLQDRYEISVTEDNGAVIGLCDAILLCIKPQVCGQVLQALGGKIRQDQLFVSIMAGVKTAAIEELLGGAPRVVRVMPNTPALVMEGASALSAGKNATADDLSLVRQMFDMVGKSWVVEEKLLDAVTGLSGSGPAYVLTFIEALSDAGVKNGLTREAATGLAAQTVFGTAKLLLETHEHPAVLRDKVTSPGGTTIAGLATLEKEGLRNAVISGVDAATARSVELGKK